MTLSELDTLSAALMDSLKPTDHISDAHCKAGIRLGLMMAELASRKGHSVAMEQAREWKERANA